MAAIFAESSEKITMREKEHMELSRKLAGECMVLLENDGTLPLKEKGKIALFGNGARHTVKGGTGSGDVNSRIIINVEQGLQENGFEITTGSWLNRFDQDMEAAYKDYKNWVKEEAKRRNVLEFAVEFDHPFKEPLGTPVTEEDLASDDVKTAIYVIARNSGEGADRYAKEGDYYLSAEEKENLKLVASHFEKTIVVLNVGGVMDMTELLKISGINAVLLMSQVGNTGGWALSDVLTGQVTPSGKLTDTWAKRYEDYPSSAEFSHNDGNVNDEYYREGIYVGYRYFDSFGVEPVYCFGYGKSYTDFEIGDVCAEIINGKAVIRCRVKNTGSDYAGKEVVQVYYSAPQGTLKKPFQELAAFQKTSLLKPGEEEELTVSFELADMASYSEAQAAWILEKGEYLIRVGNSSRNTAPAAKLLLKENVVTEQLKNLFAQDAEFEELEPGKEPAGQLTDGNGNVGLTGSLSGAEIPVLEIFADSFKTKTVSYTEKRSELSCEKNGMLTMEDVKAGRCTVEELTAQLTVEELAEFCVGTQRGFGGGGDTSVIGNASNTVPGAAGDTTALLMEKRGIKNMIFADGPAGLRLQPHFKTDLEDNLLPGGGMIGDCVEPFDPKYDETNSRDYYQYCTAIPIGWALAQSWNPDILTRAGDMVGKEMEQFHIDLWLAPALNIHRNPLCGRNFEYFSEDPYISGKMAAAITLGVQKHPGKGTTIKHFAANNQEDERYFTNSHISERAIREIYLKGFEIAIKESRPLSVMSSYNLLNGIHTANSFDLLQSVARDEWQYDGLIMTDWFTSQDVSFITGQNHGPYTISASTGCAYAGNDLQMPGCAKNVQDLIDAVTEGKEPDGFSVTKADLQFCAANVIRAVCRTDVE